MQIFITLCTFLVLTSSSATEHWEDTSFLFNISLKKNKQCCQCYKACIDNFFSEENVKSCQTQKEFYRKKNLSLTEKAKKNDKYNIPTTKNIYLQNAMNLTFDAKFMDNFYTNKKEPNKKLQRSTNCHTFYLFKHKKQSLTERMCKEGATFSCQ